MFGFKKEKTELKKIFSEADYQAENIPIHTMERDLESFRQLEEQGENALPLVAPLSETTAKSPFDQTMDSPFLPKKELLDTPASPAPRPKLESFAKTISAPLPEEDLAPAPTNETDAVFDKPEQVNDVKKKLALTSAVILIIILFSAGGYYFWSTRKNSARLDPAPQEATNEKKSETGDEQKGALPDSSSAPKFSQTARNYFMLDLGEASNDSFKQMVRNYFSEISSSKISFPVEFTLIDTSNSPVYFKAFAKKIGIKFSPELMSALNDDFSFYIYDDQGNPGVGLALSVKGQMNPEEILLREEFNLPLELGSFFPISQYAETQNSLFSTSEYDSAKWGKVGIRFRNITASGNLSIDYAFINTGKDMLFVGTTKKTLRSIIDHANPSVPSK